MASIKKKSSGGGGANWMDTYGDMVTLLLCFFVLLYSMSSIDESKWMIIVQSFNKNAVIDESARPDGPEGENDNDGGDALPMSQSDVNENMEELLEFLQTAAAAANDTMTVSQGDGYVFLSFDDAVFFEGNKSELRPEGRAALDTIIPGLVAAGPYIDEIKIMGHTAQASANQANSVRTDRMLSSARANEVLIYIQENTSPVDLDPARFQAVGMGQWRPIAQNDTPEGRAKNRRVEMMISGKNVEDTMSDSVAAYYAETNQAPPELEAVSTTNTAEAEAPVIDQSALDILGHGALIGTGNR